MTMPSQGMLQAMMSAELGDDVFQDDPTVIALERRIAEMTGKEDALFCPTGVMGNQLCIMACVHRALVKGGVAFPEVITDSRAHVYIWVGIPFNTRASVRPVVPENGAYLTPQDIEKGLQLPTGAVNLQHMASSCLLSMENPLGGSIMPFDTFKENAALAHKKGLLVHLDGARLWNASVKESRPLKEYCDHVDTVSLCMSKGMGTPMGTVIAGTKEDMWNARLFRKRLGGSMRQIGIMAAAALYAIDYNWPLMKEDHANATYLQTELVSRFGFLVPPPETNILWVDTHKHDLTWDDISQQMAPTGMDSFRIFLSLSSVVLPFAQW
eukprot:CAMPEP_0177631454 /NCGR_PEP_ID=MMETSP0447-20121125/1758_1 /TAXON_ID=0 /ORGANISM="Stygamoeba regulata, Strain BSH-02190019" /LENGTH=324 /DNA_ID=CAMNT_0019132939 /DNA_START=82 /DNA_END=1057 /DNA_ORIENTATION=+